MQNFKYETNAALLTVVDSPNENCWNPDLFAVRCRYRISFRPLWKNPKPYRTRSSGIRARGMSVDFLASVHQALISWGGSLQQWRHIIVWWQDVNRHASLIISCIVNWSIAMFSGSRPWNIHGDKMIVKFWWRCKLKLDWNLCKYFQLEY